MIRLIACDLDETLLDERKHITERNLRAIQRAKEELGVYFVPASGRGYTSMTDVMKELGVFQQKAEYTISNNGGIVIENENYQHISFHCFPFETALHLFEYGIENGLSVEVFTANQVYGFQLDEEERDWLFMFKHDAIECTEHHIDFLKDEPIVKVLFEKKDMDELYQIACDIKPLTDGKASVSFSSNRYLELNPPGVDKGKGLIELAHYLHIPIAETMAIGDNFNDKEMLEAAGVAVAVNNAIDEIKEIADYVTQSDHNESGVAEAIHHFIFEGR